MGDFPHPNLSEEINARAIQSEIEGGVWIKDLEASRSLIVKTKNSTYTITKDPTGSLWMHGNAKYCPSQTKVYISGSTWGGSMLKAGFIGRGMHMEFSTDSHPGRIVTSEIQEVEESCRLT